MAYAGGTWSQARPLSDGLGNRGNRVCLYHKVEDPTKLAKKKAQKINISDMAPLSHNPFANLGKSLGVSEEPSPAKRLPTGPEKPPETDPAKAQAMLTVALEKRKHGRVVTCIHHLADGQKTLLKQLKQKLATGGTVEEGALVLQGDHRDAVCAFLAERGFRLRKARR